MSTCIERNDLSVFREKNLVGGIPMFKVEGISLFKSIGKLQVHRRLLREEVSGRLSPIEL